jgi:hypothetical protein
VVVSPSTISTAGRPVLFSVERTLIGLYFALRLPVSLSNKLSVTYVLIFCTSSLTTLIFSST